MREKIVFFGAGPYVEEIIEILEQSFDIVRIISSSEKLDKQLIDELKSYDARVAVLASFGQIISDEVLNLFEKGIINIHPSLLPKYRGPTPVQSAILAGETISGVSIIKLDSEVDHGPILAQAEHKIEPTDTSESLYKKLFKVGAELIVRYLPKYITGELELIKQAHSKATFTDHLTRESGFIDINNQQSIISNKLPLMIRAYYPWPGVWCSAKLNGIERIIKLLPEEKIQVEGKSVMKLSDFANGYPEGQMILSQLLLS